MLIIRSKGEKVTAKAHGGTIDIQGVTVAKVNDKLQVQSLMTWFDPLDMFRQIAPKGVVNKEVVPRRAEATSETATEQPAQTPTPEETVTKSHEESPSAITTMTGNTQTTDFDARATADAAIESASAETEGSEVFHDAQQPYEHKGTQDSSSAEPIKKADAPQTSHSPTNSSSDESSWTKVSLPIREAAKESPSNTVETSMYSSSVTGAVEPAARGDVKTEQDVPETRDEVDEILSKPADQVHPHPKDMESAVKPEAGEAVLAKPASEETKQTYEEMSKMTPMQCPFMNRE